MHSPCVRLLRFVDVTDRSLKIWSGIEVNIAEWQPRFGSFASSSCHGRLREDRPPNQGFMSRPIVEDGNPYNSA